MSTPDDDVRSADLDLRIARYVDGEMPATERPDFEHDLDHDPALAVRVEELRGLRALFAAERTAAVPVPADGFAAGVLDAIRRQPLPADHGDELLPVVRAARVVTAAAAAVVIFGLTLLAIVSWADDGSGGDLVASPDEVRTEIQQLDAAIRRVSAEQPR